MNRTAISWIVAGLVVSALFWIDSTFVPLALLGPVVVGAVAGWRGVESRWPALMWAVAGIGAVVSDYVINQEDVVFHVVLTVVMVGLTALAWWPAQALARRRASHHASATV
jgi:hypothetical protein